MEFSQVVRARRMVRRYDPARQVPQPVVERLLSYAVRAPSAGFSQGWDFVVLRTAAERYGFWSATTDPAAPPDSWLAGLRTAPTLIVCCSDPQRYLDRYTEDDKGWSDRALANWPIPYWDVDTAMAALLMLLGAVDEGLGGLFFGVPAGRHEQVRTAFGIPADRRLVGVVALGYAVPHPKSPSLRRGRREPAEVAHWGGWADPVAPPP